jgi:16S rRNA (cytosine1402-N4)-methyltransferase
MKHKSVLLDEVINNLNVSEGGIYIDATVGYAGHSGEVLRKLNKKGFLFAFDQDDDAIKYSNEALSKIGSNFKIIKSNFKDMNKYINEKVDGIMFDLGVSSPQLDEAERGFSFHKDAPLDMRMDKSNPLSAKNVVNEYSYEKLVDIFFRYGEEKYSKSIAKAIVDNRPINTTLELAEIIKNNVPISYRNKSHPARKVFQAIRIEVNHELDILEDAMKDALSMLKKGGRLSVITFHSLEDRIVKNVFKEYTEVDSVVKGLPVIPEEFRKDYVLVNRKAIEPSMEELEHNNRARSAKLRIIERINE